jgi:hypothetical protein
MHPCLKSAALSLVLSLFAFSGVALGGSALRGRVVPFFDVSFSAINGQLDIDVSVLANTLRADWGATAATIAKAALKDTKLDNVKVSVLSADDSHLNLPERDRLLAVVYNYGQNSRINHEKPFELYLHKRAPTEAEMRADTEYWRLIASYQKKYGDEGGDRKLGVMLAKKYSLTNEWLNTLSRDRSDTESIDQVDADLDDAASRQIGAIVSCVASASSTGWGSGRC